MGKDKEMMELKEHNLPLSSFIAGWYIDPKICDELIALFKENKEHQGPGVVAWDGRVDKSMKVSTDFGLHKTYQHPAFLKYKKLLGTLTDLYKNKYPEVKQLSKFEIMEKSNIQYYAPGGGYFVKHFERSSRAENRCLVWMTYLNDVAEGGTHFKYQNLTTPAKKGLTLIWPPDFTHTHSGQITQHHEKYIITGWMGYITNVIYVV